MYLGAYYDQSALNRLHYFVIVTKNPNLVWVDTLFLCLFLERIMSFDAQCENLLKTHLQAIATDSQDLA